MTRCSLCVMNKWAVALSALQQHGQLPFLPYSSMDSCPFCQHGSRVFLVKLSLFLLLRGSRPLSKRRRLDFTMNTLLPCSCPLHSCDNCYQPSSSSATSHFVGGVNRQDCLNHAPCNAAETTKKEGNKRHNRQQKRHHESLYAVCCTREEAQKGPHKITDHTIIDRSRWA